MGTNPTAPQIDLEAIKAAAKAAVAGMTKEQLLQEAEKIRTRQKFQQKKQQAKGGNKEYMKKKLEKERLIREAIEALGLTEQVNAKADAEAEKLFEEHIANQPEEEGETATA